MSGTERVGGLVGWAEESETNNSFWNVDTSGQGISDGGEGKSTAEMKDMNTYINAGWDLTDVWQIVDGYPYLTWEDDDTLPVELSSFTAMQTSNNLAQIKWVTASESGVLGYDVYRAETEEQNSAIRITPNMI